MKLKDIRKNLDESLDLSDNNDNENYELIWDESQSFKDIDKGKKDISLLWESNIILENKKTKKIDPLSKKMFFSRNISLKPKVQKHRIHINIINKKLFYEKIIGNLYFLFFLWFSFFLGAFLYKDLLEKYLTYSYETLSFIPSDFPNHKKINENISEAKNAFLVTQYLFQPISFLNTQSVKDADKLIEWWKYLTQSLEQFSRIWFDLLFLTEGKDIWKILFSHFLDNSKENFFWAMNDMRKAHDFYTDIDDLWEVDLNKKLKYLRDSIWWFVETGNYLEENYETFLDILWHNQRKKYMIVFQNSDEIRPQWWFMGSVWFIEIFWWKIEKFEKKDIYALEWEINKDPFREPAPEWIDRLTKTFWLRDANYFISPGASSEKIREILARGNIEIDGVIYANINLAKDLLNAIWWFDSKVLGQKIDGDNFSLIMSSLVESKKSREATLDSPKNILFDFIDEFFNDLKVRKDYSLYASVFMNALKTRDIFMFAFDSKSEDFLYQMWWDGEIRYQDTLDFNYPVFTSISWNKSDRYVERSYTKYVNIFDNCDIHTRLNIKQRHNFSLADEKDAINTFEFYDIDIEENLFIQWLGNNKQFVRIVIPKSAIVKNKNVVIQNYPKTKVVEFYMDTPRFESSYFVLHYVLENPDCREYSYNFYKQPGITNYNFWFHSISENMKFTWIRQDFEYKLK